MSLKQECIDMFTLIFKGLREYEDYDIEENTTVFLCSDEDYKDIEVLSYECYKCHKREICNKDYVEVDLSVFVPWWAGDEDGGSIYINFKKVPVKQQYKNTIYYINNRKQLIDLIYKMKQRVDHMKNAYAEYAEKIIELRQYGQEFLLQVQKDYPVFNSIKIGDLPLVFSDFAKEENGTYRYDTGGDFDVVDIQLIIHVYDCWRGLDELKTTIRHEIFHYLLFRVGVNNSDSGGIFHYFCKKYDAHAYKEMAEEEQKIYSDMVELSPKEISDMLEGVKKKIVMYYAK